MGRKDEDRELADGLLDALGLKSVVRSLVLPKGQDRVPDHARTGVYGRAWYSTANRRVMLDALGQEPRPETLRRLHERLVQMAEDRDPKDLAEVLAAVRGAAEEQPELALDELVRSRRS